MVRLQFKPTSTPQAALEFAPLTSLSSLQVLAQTSYNDTSKFLEPLSLLDIEEITQSLFNYQGIHTRYKMRITSLEVYNEAHSEFLSKIDNNEEQEEREMIDLI